MKTTASNPKFTISTIGISILIALLTFRSKLWMNDITYGDQSWYPAVSVANHPTCFSTSLQRGQFLILSATRSLTKINPSITDHPKSKAAHYLNLLLLLAGDTELNPGPTSATNSTTLNTSSNISHSDHSKYPCGLCESNVSWSHRAVCCDCCDVWFHVTCMAMSSEVYEAMHNSSTTGICNKCGMSNFSSSLSTFILPLSNTYEPLSPSLPTIGDSQTSIDTRFDPLDASSPIPKKRNTNTNKKSQLKVIIVNFNSVKGKTSELAAMTESVQPDIILGTESKLDNTILTSEIFPPNYNVFRRDRTINGGGVFIAVHDSLIASEKTAMNKVDCEIMWTEIKISRSKPLLVGCFYRPPNTKLDVLEQLEISLNKLPTSARTSNILLGGDFNLGDILWDSQSVRDGSNCTGLCTKLLQITADFSLEQVVDKPTRGDNILDLLLTTNPGLVNRCQIIPGISDHDIPTAFINLKAKLNRKKPRRVFQYHKANLDNIRTEIHKMEIGFFEKIRSLKQHNLEITANGAWIHFKTNLLEIMHEHIPTKMTSSRFNLPWFTRSLRRSCRLKQRLYNRAKTTNKLHDWSSSKKARKAFKSELHHAHHKYFLDVISPNLDSTSKNNKSLWSYIKSKRQDSFGISTLRSNGKLHDDPVSKAEILNNQYHSVFTQENTSNVPSKGNSPYPNMPDIRINSNGISKLLKTLNTTKATGPDEVPALILKEAADSIAPMLQFIFTRSLETGQLPDDWVCANISPIFKKNDRTDPANYRPVSLTSISCKIFEHILHSQVMAHLEQHSILNERQHGFRKRRSCETQLILTVDDLSQSINSKKLTDLIILDFSKAFDVVPHYRLLHKLQYYGIRGQTLQWIKAFLTTRRQRVLVDGHFSNYISVDSGVPQGTVLGPLLFLLFINDITDNISEGTQIRLFADDCLLYRHINSRDDSTKLQQDLDGLVNWADTWNMKFNSVKCHTMHTTLQRSPYKHVYNIKGNNLLSVNKHPYLGVELSDDLKWKHHTRNITAKANRSLGFLRRNLSPAPKTVKTKLYQALVRPLVEYCSTAWDPHTASDVRDIEMIQRRAARFVCHKYSPLESVTEMLADLQWDSLQNRRETARLSMMYKIVNNKVDIDAEPHLKKVTRATRHSQEHSFQTIAAKTDAYKYSFFPRTIRDWNRLPSAIVNAPSVDSFKSAVSTHKSQ